MLLQNGVSMKKWFALLLSLWSFYINGNQQFPRSNIVPPVNVRSAKFNRECVSTSNDSSSKVYASLTPKIHNGIWPDFCFKHLQSEPEGCSQWGLDENNNVQLSFLINGQAEAQIDRALIERLEHLGYLIPSRKRGSNGYCDYVWCPGCSQTVIRGISYCECDEDEEDDEGNDVYSYVYFPVYKCDCTGQWWLDPDDLLDEDCDIFKDWQFCEAPTIYHGYFDWHHQTYFHNLKNLLEYIDENPTCTCYWPQIDACAKEISDSLYEKLTRIFKAPTLSRTCKTFTPFLADVSLDRFLPGLLTHAFFYSHYRNILLDLDQHNFKELQADSYPLIHNQFIDAEESMHQRFLQLYSQCLQKHPHPKIYYERGMVYFHRGENLDALEDIRRFIAYAKKNHYQEFLTSDLYLKEGRLLSESLSYDEAIVALTNAIEKDPTNKDAYFERAIAYFEKGDFALALSDYLASGIRPKKVDPAKMGKLNYVTFGQGIALGMIKGSHDSVTEFIPSLLASFRGISKGIWICVSSPIAVSQDLIDCANACLEFIKDNTIKELLCKIIPELQECIKKWDQLDDFNKGRYVGYIIGKYGVDIFLCSGSLKGIQLYRNLRRANAVMTLETAAISPKLAQEVLEQSAKEWAIRENLIKSGRLKIEWDKQGKHIPGHKNYDAKRFKSILEHPNPEKLLKNHAGTGFRNNSVVAGKEGYKEVVDFQEFIGFVVDQNTGEKIPTTWGKIHYSKKGGHIVPTKPRS